MKLRLTSIVWLCFINFTNSQPLLPSHWNPKKEADKIPANLVKVTASQVRGGHDAEMVIVDNHAYIVSEVNDIRAGEAAGWPFIYVTMSVVNLTNMETPKVITVAQSAQPFENE